MFEGDGTHELKRKVGMIQLLDLSRRKKKKTKKNIAYSPPFEKWASQRKEKKISELISAFINTY
jgi:ABC-type proline/glycine betaine transport system ATPase subunit